MAKKKYPKPIVIGEIPMVVINGEVYGIEISQLSEEEQNDLKKQSKKDGE